MITMPVVMTPALMIAWTGQLRQVTCLTNVRTRFHNRTKETERSWGRRIVGRKSTKGSTEDLQRNFADELQLLEF